MSLKLQHTVTKTKQLGERPPHLLLEVIVFGLRVVVLKASLLLVVPELS